MSRQSPTEVELLEICNYLEKVLRDGSRSSITSVLELLSRDDCPYTPMLKAKWIYPVEQSKAMSSISISSHNFISVNPCYLYLMPRKRTSVVTIVRYKTLLSRRWWMSLVYKNANKVNKGHTLHLRQLNSKYENWKYLACRHNNHD